MHPIARKRKLDSPNDDPDLLLVVHPKPKRPRLTLSSPSPTPPPKSKRHPPAYALHRRSSLPTSTHSPSPLPPSPTSKPSLLPPITRDTLRELDLDAILRNPQLRHDLLFDPGLQFRPTSGRRKHLAAQHYWSALSHELENSPPPSDSKRSRRPPTPPPWSPRYFSPANHDADIRPPSRLKPMIQELLAVLSSVIVPPSLPTSSQHTSADARALLDHLDPEFITQELRRGLFDPTGLFSLIATTLKRHCAPMRDKLVEAMLRCAQGSDSQPDSVLEPESPTRRTIRTVRMCFEILELMKLDIANHQLQHLRPFLAASTPDFELRTFLDQCRRTNSSPHITRAWLQQFHPPPTSSTPNSKTHTTVIHALTHLIFHPVPVRQRPETLYLDSSRITLLEKDAADLTALYMLVMLWRQMVCSSTKGIEDWEVDRVKREIWEIGPKRIGSCFLEESEENRCKWESAMENVALQIALRAEDRSPTVFASCAAGRKPPSKEKVALMRGWISSHLRRESHLAGQMRDLLQGEVIRVVCGEGAAAATAKAAGTEGESGTGTTGLGSRGLEPLQPEIAHLAQRLAKLSCVHVAVYWSLYESGGFLRR